MAVRIRENLHAIYVLLFLHFAFFLLERQDPVRFAGLFAFVPGRVLAGDYWRVFTYQFAAMSPLSLFFTMLIVYWMGSTLEELWGTLDLVAYYLLTVLGGAAIAFLLGASLYSSIFASLALTFAFAYEFPEQVIYIFFVLPVKVKWLAYLALAFLLFGSFTGSRMAMAELGGCALSFGFMLVRRGVARRIIRRAPRLQPQPSVNPAEPPKSGLADGNLVLFGKVKEALEHGSATEREVLIRQIEPRIVRGVNICPPADFKPEKEDRYCASCEGFAECSIRYMRAKMAAESPAVISGDAKLEPQS